jgi:hypothetical protein
MALAAKQSEQLEVKRPPAEIVPMPTSCQPIGTKTTDVTTKTLGNYLEQTTRVVQASKDSARRAYNQIRPLVSRGYSGVVGRAKNLGRRAQNGAQQVRQEHPLQLVAMIAGAAFVAGVAIRIWRSRIS